MVSKREAEGAQAAEYTHWTDEGEPVEQLSAVALERGARKVYRYGNRMAPDVIVYVLDTYAVVEYPPTGIMRRFEDINTAFAFAAKRGRHARQIGGLLK